jgi:hypothetical protein
MVCFDWLNLVAGTFVISAIDVARPELEENMFGVGASIEKSSHTLIIRELSLFRRLSIPSSTCADPLAWWWMHEGQFPNVGFLAKQNFGILGS